MKSERLMKKAVLARLAVALTSVAVVGTAQMAALAQVPLSAYQDERGYINVQALTCAQLINTFQEDADMLATWYSGWYNGLAKKHYANIPRIKSGEHQLILYCRQHPQLRIIEAIDVLLREEKAKR